MRFSISEARRMVLVQWWVRVRTVSRPAVRRVMVSGRVEVRPAALRTSVTARMT